MPSSPRKSALGSSNAVPKSVTPSSRENSRSSSQSLGGELERLAVLAVRAAEAVLVVVRRVVQLPRVEAAVVALLELDGVDAALLRRVDECLGLLDVALVVVADLRDDVRGAVPRDGLAVDDQLAHGTMVLAAADDEVATRERRDTRESSPPSRQTTRERSRATSRAAAPRRRRRSRVREERRRSPPGARADRAVGRGGR